MAGRPNRIEALLLDYVEHKSDPVFDLEVDGPELAKAAVTVVRRLKMEHERFQVAFVGGVFAAGELVIRPLREDLARVAKKAFIAPPHFSPTVAAGRLAQEHLHGLPVAV